MVTVYSQPGCHSCEHTKAYLAANNVSFTDKNIQNDPAALKEFDALGYQGTPVVVAGDKHWSGHDVARLAALVV
jgi:glutaredoxin-like protein NrdH